ncbi:MAG: hypothetical protein IIY19_03755, partial [Lachnospiraceae bacterium]|nr:hypothetical protein [Lachnospiraceae bacterium]
YCLALIAYQIGGLIGGNVAFGIGTIVALLLTAAIFFLLFRKGYVPAENKKSLTSVQAADR